MECLCTPVVDLRVSVLSGNLYGMQLEFGLQVHFALWPLMINKVQHDKLDMLKRMSNFKTYLENRGAILVSHADFLPYYALPHVPEPENHPSFQHLLDPQCMAAQRLQLEDFLKVLPDRCNQPRLYGLLPSSNMRPFSSRSTAGLSESSPDPSALLTGKENLDSFIGKTPVNMSFEQLSAAVSPDQLQQQMRMSEEQAVPAVVASSKAGTPLLGMTTTDIQTISNPKDQDCCRDAVLENEPVLTVTETGLDCKDAHKGSPAITGLMTASLEAPRTASSTPDPGQATQHGLDSDTIAVEPVLTASSEPTSEPTDDAPCVPTAAHQGGVEVNNLLDSPGKNAQGQPAHTADMEDKVACGEVAGTSELRSNRASVAGRFAEHSTVSPGQAQSHAAIRRSITRTAQEQAQLPAIAWDLVKRHLWSADVALRAALLQVRGELGRSPVPA